MLKVSCLVTALYCLSPCKQAALTVKTVSDRAEQTKKGNNLHLMQYDSMLTTK